MSKQKKTESANNDQLSAIMWMLQWIQSWITTLSERVDKIEAEAKKTPAQKEQRTDKVWHDVSRNTVPKAVKVVQYITHPDWSIEHKIPWRTFRNKVEADAYVKPLLAQWKTFSYFYI